METVIPDEYICPLTMDIMEEPVIDNEGVSYEKTAIVRWLERGRETSPSTGNPLREADLRPNLALKSAIEKFLRDNENEVIQKPVAYPSDQQLIRQSGIATDKRDTALELAAKCYGGEIFVSVSAPESTQLAKSSICCVVDTSGSMDEEATIVNESGTKEGFGLSVLDVTKHAINTIIMSLTSNDRFSLVSFNTKAELVCEPMFMNERNQKKALAHVKKLQPMGMTNLWDGLTTGLDVLNNKVDRHLNSALFLLTDGLPNHSPGKGELNALKSYSKKHDGLPCLIHTFGFGYNMDSPMLNDLAQFGGGAYSFIPDSSLVGTVFVNAISNHLVTAATNIRLTVNAGKNVRIVDGHYKLYEGEFSDVSARISMGSVQFGQSKTLTVPVVETGDPYAEVTVSYCIEGQTYVVDTRVDCEDKRAAMPTKIGDCKERLLVVSAIRKALSNAGVSFSSRRGDVQVRDPALGLQVIREAEMALSGTTQFSRDLKLDLSGEIAMAFSTDENLKRWGLHFCLSIMGAHLQQCCNNFKDPGVQHYCTDLFSDTRDKLDEIFVKLPPPQPTPKHVADFGGHAPPPRAPRAPVSMAMFMNQAGGCIHGSCLVSMRDRKFARVDQIRKGDAVLTGRGTYDQVECVVETVLPAEDEGTWMTVSENGLLTTPWHPIRVGGEWVFPCSVGVTRLRLGVGSVFSVLLAGRGTLVVNDVECASLAHGLTDQGGVIGHHFLGTERVVHHLRALPGWHQGSVQVYSDWFLRDNDGRVNAIAHPNL